jgi:hypothetical protein
VIGVDEGGIRGISGVDPLTRGVGFVERDSDDREAFGAQLVVEDLPPGKVVPAPSP